MVRSFAFWGEIDTDYQSWVNWIDDALKICEWLGYPANHYGFDVMGRTDGKVHPITGMSRKLKNVRDKKEVIVEGIILTLPKDYTSAIFDYIITFSRCPEYILLSLNQDYEMQIDEKKLIDLLRRNIHAASGEVYEMDIDDCPEFYAAKANPDKPIQSYKKIATL